jgi:hypothetical protein
VDSSGLTLISDFVKIRAAVLELKHFDRQTRYVLFALILSKSSKQRIIIRKLSEGTQVFVCDLRFTGQQILKL